MASRWDTWVERYKPIQNTIAQHRPEFMFETYGDEYQFIVETDLPPVTVPTMLPRIRLQG